MKTPSWKISAKKMIHISGFSINLATRAELIIPTGVISLEQGMDLIRDLGQKVSFEGMLFRIAIDDQTTAAIHMLIDAGFTSQI